MSVEKTESILDRLYTKDIKSRKEKHKMLLEIYKPSFSPNIYTNSNYNNIKKLKNQSQKKNKNNYNNNFDNVNNDETNCKNNITRFEVDEENEDNFFYKNNYLKVNRIIKIKKANKQNLDDKDDSESNNSEEENNSLVLNALREKLFKNIKKHRRAKSLLISN